MREVVLPLYADVWIPLVENPSVLLKHPLVASGNAAERRVTAPGKDLSLVFCSVPLSNAQEHVSVSCTRFRTTTDMSVPPHDSVPDSHDSVAVKTAGSGRRYVFKIYSIYIFDL